ncbi:hypothetical protein LAZ67_13000384 [Cordylochernes scorpioides]|uniref:Uncharacterized protein n=1 Tax=Cordylochernes scorpioides TaxID=51811 RepID=A0ABY6L2X5_9ARAC|nr:hypothetical protein LAZ67_13000384 [Cordylochernes scorpioides]
MWLGSLLSFCHFILVYLFGNTEKQRIVSDCCSNRKDTSSLFIDSWIRSKQAILKLQSGQTRSLTVVNFGKSNNKVKEHFVICIDAQLNQTMRLITGNMRPTPIDWLPYLSNIAPPDLRRKKSTSNLLSKIKANTKLPINTVLEIPPPTRLISRNPAWVADENVDLKEEWRNRWSNLAIANKDLVEDPNTKPPGYNLPRRTWSTLNRIRTSTGRCNYLLNKWNMSPDQNCDCGQIQTMHHILRDCPRRFFQGTLGDIHRCTEEALEWIRHLDIPL